MQAQMQTARTAIGRSVDEGWRQRLGMYFDMEGRPCTLGRWMELFETRTPETAQVGLTHKAWVEISTAWLGANHNYLGGPPLIFETMVFGGPLTENQWRYATWEQAEAGHEAVVREAFRWYRNPEYRILACWVGGLTTALGLVLGLR